MVAGSFSANANIVQILNVTQSKRLENTAASESSMGKPYQWGDPIREDEKKKLKCTNIAKTDCGNRDIMQCFK